MRKKSEEYKNTPQNFVKLERSSISHTNDLLTLSNLSQNYFFEMPTQRGIQSLDWENKNLSDRYALKGNYNC